LPGFAKGQCTTSWNMCVFCGAPVPMQNQKKKSINRKPWSGIMEPHKTWPRQWLESAGVLGWDASLSNDTLSLNTQLDTLYTVWLSRQWVLLSFRIPLVWQRSSGKINEIDSIGRETVLSSGLPWTTSCMFFLHTLSVCKKSIQQKAEAFWALDKTVAIGCIGRGVYLFNPLIMLLRDIA